MKTKENKAFKLYYFIVIMSVIDKKLEDYRARDLGKIRLVHFFSESEDYMLDHKGSPMGQRQFPVGFDIDAVAKKGSKHIYGTESNQFYQLRRLVPATYNNVQLTAMALFDTNRARVHLPDVIDGKVISKFEDRILVLDKPEEWVYSFTEDSDEKFIKEHIIPLKPKK